MVSFHDRQTSSATPRSLRRCKPDQVPRVQSHSRPEGRMPTKADAPDGSLTIAQPRRPTAPTAPAPTAPTAPTYRTCRTSRTFLPHQPHLPPPPHPALTLPPHETLQVGRLGPDHRGGVIARLAALLHHPYLRAGVGGRGAHGVDEQRLVLFVRTAARDEVAPGPQQPKLPQIDLLVAM